MRSVQCCPGRELESSLSAALLDESLPYSLKANCGARRSAEYSCAGIWEQGRDGRSAPLALCHVKISPYIIWLPKGEFTSALQLPPPQGIAVAGNEVAASPPQHSPDPAAWPHAPAPWHRPGCQTWIFTGSFPRRLSFFFWRTEWALWMGEEEKSIPERSTAACLGCGRALEMGRAGRNVSREPFPRHVGSSLLSSQSLPCFSFRTS